MSGWRIYLLLIINFVLGLPTISSQSNTLQYFTNPSSNEDLNTESLNNFLAGSTNTFDPESVHRKTEEDSTNTDSIRYRTLTFVHSPFQEVVPTLEMSSGVGSVFTFRTHATSHDVDGIFVSGTCQRTRDQIADQEGVAWCDFVYSFQDDYSSSIAASGVALDGHGGRLAIDGGSGLLKNVRGEIKIDTTYFENGRNFLLDSELYTVTATLIL